MGIAKLIAIAILTVFLSQPEVGLISRIVLVSEKVDTEATSVQMNVRN
jgi:hypothetical protein